MDRVRVPIVSGLGDVAPPSVIKGTGNRYAIVSKAAEFLKVKVEIYKYLDHDDPVTKNQFIHTYCSYVPPSGRITRHELIYRVLEYAESYNNFRRIGIQHRNLHDIGNYAINQGVDKKQVLVPAMGDNPIYSYADPTELVQYEESIIEDCRRIETF